MSQLGRISGKLLADNLLRNGIDLNFKNTLSDDSLLKLDVNSNKIGINLNNPAKDLELAQGSTLKTDSVIADSANISGFEIDSTQISVSAGNISIQSQSVIRSSALRTDGVKFDDTAVSTLSNKNLNLKPDQTNNLDLITFEKREGLEVRQDFGRQVNIGPNHVIVGTETEDQNIGSAFLFEQILEGSLHKLSDNPIFLQPSNSSIEDNFGFSVAVSDSFAVVGAPGKNNNKGSVYLYSVDGTFVGEVSGEIANDEFGFSVAILNGSVYVGAPGTDSETGSLYYVDIDNLSATKIIPTGAIPSDRVGESIAANQASVFVGSPNTNKVYEFSNAGENSVYLQMLTPSDGFTGDRFGFDLDCDNTVLLIGSPRDDDKGPNSGSVYEYDISNSYAVTKLFASDPNSFDNFGSSVSISDRFKIIGAPKADSPDPDSGTAYVIDRLTNAETKLEPTEREANDQFGNSVAANNKQIIVASSNDGDLRTGSVYAFDIYTPGSVEISSNLDVFGNIYTPNQITIQGNLELGNSPDDTVTFNADLNSDLLPNTDDISDIGQQDKQWNFLYTELLNGSAIEVETQFLAGGIDLSLSQGNIFYVSTNGSDIAKGDNQQGPVRTIKRALELADGSRNGPVVVYIFPGVYEEEFPLTVPPNTAIRGTDLRNTIVKPAPGFGTQNAFELDGETTVEDITVADFYYDALNDTGYAFVFKDGAIVTSRSPYIKNISVITKGNPTSTNDPRGFDAGNAGKGALVDGSRMHAMSAQSSMLFHSATFITPGVDAITMTNGVRVEWLNSFSYFANRGLYAKQGTQGFADEGVVFGAELRSIGSAAVYGNKGAEADGADTLMYLIGQNFAYIGAGKKVENDAFFTQKDNETIELNNGKIYHTSTDAEGTFNVGDGFFVNLKDGTTSIAQTGVNLSGVSRITIAGNGPDTVIDAEKIDIGNFRLNGNTIQTLSDTFIFSSASGISRTNTDTVIDKNLQVTKNLNLNGSLNTIGNQTSDTVEFNVDFDQNIFPGNDTEFNLGSTDKKWFNSYLSTANFGDLLFQDNFIASTLSNSDIEFQSNAAGFVNYDQVSFKNNIIDTVTNDLIFETPGNFSLNITGALKVPIGNNAERKNNQADIRFNNTDNIFEINIGSPTGLAGVYSTDRQTSLTASANNIIGIANSVQTLLITNQYVNLGGLTVEDVSFDDNNIFSNNTNSDLELRTQGSGELVIDNFSIKENVITNFKGNNVFYQPIDSGYLKIDGSGGAVIPAGSSIERPDNPIEGNSRYNTDRAEMEVYDGEKWIPAIGDGDAVTDEAMAELTDIYTLILG